ncbi:hypothetical protein EV207_13139 [Scopulibacillus darangshiensis]|uniref:Uncharacterized protein n=1 Tax=Scopulibacillus darangshiensis TaxID=442528 RepID=A0A4R2NP22_9BACL|nr:hypothetical protein [Scopulibacillus darangshiensis]TCP23477.1 hypothetical protein EV207_13139 [Scopulibacillus darangshiensis]
MDSLIKEKRYALYVASGKLYSAQCNPLIIDLAPYIKEREAACREYIETYEKVYGQLPNDDDLQISLIDG